MKALRPLLLCLLLMSPPLVLANPMATGMAAYLSGDYQRAIREWRPLAEAGNPIAQYHMGVIYRDGRGVDIDLSEAIRWWTLAANNGHAKAQYELGMAYRRGLGVKRDQKKSAEWLEKSAVLTSVRAQDEVGNLYYQGRGVAKSLEKAKLWWTRAAQSGHVGSRRKLAQLEKGETITFEEQPDKSFINGGDWLYRQNPDAFTLQLISDFSNDRIRRFIERTGLQGNMAMFAALRGDQPLLSLVYGVYPDLASARKALGQLSEPQRAGAPLIRRIRDVEGTLEAAVEQNSPEHVKKTVTDILKRLGLEKTANDSGIRRAASIPATEKQQP